MKIIFDNNASKNEEIKKSVIEFLSKVKSLESSHNMAIIIFQDGASGSYYIKCSLTAEDAAKLCDLSAKLDVKNPESYRANRELLLKHATYLKMEDDSAKGREFNDIIVEYNTAYKHILPLKVWGGQHRINAISAKGKKANRYHGFRIYFNLSKKERTELALVSNTNISVSNDTFDRMVEETLFGIGTSLPSSAVPSPRRKSQLKSWDSIISSLTALDPKGRPSSIQEVAVLLDRVNKNLRLGSYAQETRRALLGVKSKKKPKTFKISSDEFSRIVSLVGLTGFGEMHHFRGPYLELSTEHKKLLARYGQIMSETGADGPLAALILLSSCGKPSKLLLRKRHLLEAQRIALRVLGRDAVMFIRRIAQLRI